MTINPAMPPALIAVAAALLIATALRSRAGFAPAAARIAGLALLIACVLGVSRSAPVATDPAALSLHVLVDTSRSMRTLDALPADAATTRLAALQRAWLDPNPAARLAAAANLTISAFDTATRAVPVHDAPSLTPDGDATRAFHAIERAAAAAPPGASILILTDAADPDTEAPSRAADAAIAAGVRIDAVIVGEPAHTQRPRLALIPDAHFVFDAQQTTLHVRIHPAPSAAAATLRITERIAGAARTILERSIDLNTPHEFAIPVRPRAGVGVSIDAAAYTAELLVDGDTSAQAHAVIQVSAAPLRVLLLEGEPSWDTRFLLDALRADPWIDATSLAAAGPRERILRSVPAAVEPDESSLEAFSLTPESLADFQVVILGRGVERWITPQRAGELAQWVSQGGALVFLRADPVAGDDENANSVRTALEAISPVAWGRRMIAGGRLVTTPDGRRDARLDFGALGEPDSVLAALPGALATSLHEGERTLTSVWLRTQGDEQPAAAVAHLRVGAGASLAVLSEGLWRWRMAPPAAGAATDAHAAYDAFWSHTLRRLAGMGDLRALAPIRVAAERTTAAPGDAVTIDIRARPGLALDAPPRVRAIDEAGATTILTLVPAADRAWRARFTPTAPGVYTIQADAPAVLPSRTIIVAAHTDTEDLDTAPRTEAIAGVVAATGGRLWDLHALDAYLEAIRAAEPAPAAADMREPAPRWRTWWVFALITALLGADWLIRRARGAL